MNQTEDMAGNDGRGDEESSEKRPLRKPKEKTAGDKVRKFLLRVENKTMYLPEEIYKAIIESKYFQELVVKRLKTFDHVVGEIHLKASSLGPWECTPLYMWCGNGIEARRVPPVVTVAYCCMFRLFQMKMTKVQLESMLEHKNPYVRGVGYLYIRYNLQSEALWNWYEEALKEDQEELNVIPGRGQESTIAGVLYSLLTKKQWFETQLPRIFKCDQMTNKMKLKAIFKVPPPAPDVLTGPPKKRPSVAEDDITHLSSDDETPTRERSSSPSSCEDSCIKEEPGSSPLTVPQRHSARERSTRGDRKTKQ